MWLRLCACLFVGGAMVGAAHGQEAMTAPETLGLAEAERLSLEQDPATRAFEARAGALSEQSVSEGRLPDPKLRFGVESVPTDSWRLDEEAMTQLRIGLVQEFPRGRSRALREEWVGAQARGFMARANEQRLQTLRETRRAWWEAWYQNQALDTVHEANVLFQRLVGIAEAQYAQGRDNQQAVLQARVEAARLGDREDAVRAQWEAARAALARWVGAASARRPLPIEIPPPAIPPALDELVASLPSHPAVGAETAEIEASDKESDLARQEYKPGFALDLSYSKRYGEEPDGEPRSDLVSAMIEMELPLFPGKRQDKRVAASEYRAQAARHARDLRLRELRAQLETDFAEWHRLGTRLERFRSELVPQSALNASAADRAYRNRTVDFAVLVRAHLDHLESRLDALRMQADYAQAAADLAYFSGVLP